MNTLQSLKDRSTTGLKAAITRLEISRDQYRQDLAETQDKLQLIEASMSAMHKKYGRLQKETQCPAVSLLCQLVHQDLTFITEINNKTAKEILNP